MKKIINIFILILVSFALIGCNQDNRIDPGQVEATNIYEISNGSVYVDLINVKEEYKNSNMEYSFDSEKWIPFVAQSNMNNETIYQVLRYENNTFYAYGDESITFNPLQTINVYVRYGRTEKYNAGKPSEVQTIYLNKAYSHGPNDIETSNTYIVGNDVITSNYELKKYCIAYSEGSYYVAMQTKGGVVSTDPEMVSVTREICLSNAFFEYIPVTQELLTTYPSITGDYLLQTKFDWSDVPMEGESFDLNFENDKAMFLIRYEALNGFVASPGVLITVYKQVTTP